MSDGAWQARLSPKAQAERDGLPEHARIMLRDVLELASRDPWGWPAWDRSDPEGEDVRGAAIGQLTVTYWINRPAGRLYVIDITWLG